MDRIKCGTLVQSQYGYTRQPTIYRIIREFGNGYEIFAECEVIECGDKRGLGKISVMPLKTLTLKETLPSY